MYQVYLVAPKEVSLHSSAMAFENSTYSSVNELKNNSIDSIYTRRIQENIGIGSIAAWLRNHDIQTCTINAYIEEIDNQKIVDMILQDNPQIVGFSLLYNLHFFNAIQLIVELRKKGYKNHITIGGTFASLAYERILKTCPLIDSVIVGDGEAVFLDLYDSLANGSSFYGREGIAYVDEKKNVVFVPKECDTHEINYANVSRDTLQFMKHNGYQFSTAAIYGSRGCNNRCIYCSAPSLHKLCNKVWRPRNIDSLVEEIEMLKNEFRIQYLYFCDDNFCGYGTRGKNHILSFVQKMKERKLCVNFHAELRVDCGLSDEEICALKEIGLEEALLGIENGSQSCLNRWKKGVKVEANEQMLAQLRRCNVKVAPAYIMVDAYTSVDEFIESVDFVERNELYKMGEPWYLFNKMMVYPGTYLEKKMIDDGVIQCNSYRHTIEISSSLEDIYKYCCNIGVIEYRICDKQIEILWEKLTWQVNDLIDLVSTTLPNYFSEIRRIDATKCIQYIHGIRLWRKYLGELLMQFLRYSRLWLKEQKDEATLKNDLQQLRIDYDKTYLEMDIREYIERSCKRE